MTVFVVDIEPVETRYTGQWKTHVPWLLKRHGLDVSVISGGDVPQATTPGAFLNFAGTNNYKSQQMLQISELFAKGQIKDGDYFLYTDAWNPTVIQLRYMAELLGVSVRIGGLWHAGSYDPQDFLGRLIGNKPWVRHAEKSMFEVYDHNFFASDFHIELFLREQFGLDNPWIDEDVEEALLGQNDQIRRVGWPMEYLEDCLVPYSGMEKENLILFPHRIAPEKQPEIFHDLKQALPQYNFVTCQEQTLSKNEYHNLLGTAKLVFSANLQETLGISWYEGALVGALPMVPDRLSYSEMAVDDFKYPSEWTEDFAAYKANRDKVIARVQDYVEHYDNYLASLHKQVEMLKTNFFSATNLIQCILDDHG